LGVEWLPEIIRETDSTSVIGTMFNLINKHMEAKDKTIFNKNEVSELYEIKEKISINYLRDLEIDTFSNQDEEELLSFIKNSFNTRGISFDEYDMKNILNIISNNILI
jgi:hypothetical protein